MSNAEFITVNIDDIEVDDRARKDFGDIKELANSIKREGLIHPISVVKQEGKDKPYKLLAGGRRLEAKKYNKDTTTLVRIFSTEMSPLEMKSIELAENFYRKDFTWQETVRLQKEVHELQVAIHGEKVSTLPDATGWSQADTAKLLNRAKSGVSADIKLAEALEEMPALFDGVKTKDEAGKLLRKIQETVVREELATRVRESSAGNDRLKKLSNAYIVKDFFEFASNHESKVFNLVEIDPPYGINLNDLKGKAQKFDANNYDMENYKEIDINDYEAFMRKMLTESYRLAADHAWLILWFGPEPWFENMYQWMTDAGWKGSRLCGIWEKNYGQSLSPNTRLANTYEMFFYACKGNPVIAKPGRSNEFRYSPVAGQKKIHPTQRPLDLMVDIYSTFTFEGSRVLIPCAGSGTGILAADRCAMTPIATDINNEYKNNYLIMANDYLIG